MRPTRPRALADRDRRRAWLVLAVLAIAAALDLVDAAAGAAPRAPYTGAAVFAVIWIGLQFVATWLGTVAEITVTYLGTVVAWLVGRVANILISTGAVFARIWDAMRIVWSDVLRPALVWIDGTIRRLHTWLVDTFRPVFDWLKEIRERLLGLYKTFVRPVLDTIDFIRALNQVLLQFHITFLQGLDELLTKLQQRIEEPIFFLFRQLSLVQNLLDRVVGLDGFFQRYALVASLRKYLPDWVHYFWSDQIAPPRGRDGSADRTRDYPPHDSVRDKLVLTEYFETGGGDAAGRIDELKIILRQVATGTAPAPLADPV